MVKDSFKIYNPTFAIIFKLSRQFRPEDLISVGQIVFNANGRTYAFDADSSYTYYLNDTYIGIKLEDIVDPITDGEVAFDSKDLKHITKFNEFYVFIESKEKTSIESIEEFSIEFSDAGCNHIRIDVDHSILQDCFENTLSYEFYDLSENKSYYHNGKDVK